MSLRVTQTRDGVRVTTTETNGEFKTVLESSGVVFFKKSWATEGEARKGHEGAVTYLDNGGKLSFIGLHFYPDEQGEANEDPSS